MGDVEKANRFPRRIVDVSIESPGLAAGQRRGAAKPWIEGLGAGAQSPRHIRARRNMIHEVLAEGARRGELASTNRNEVLHPGVLVKTILARGSRWGYAGLAVGGHQRTQAGPGALDVARPQRLAQH